MTLNSVRLGDCLELLPALGERSVDLVYVDPPFFTQKVHALTTRDGKSRYSFRDLWRSRHEYGDFLLPRMEECRRCLKDTGVMFFHCDDNSGHIARLILDELFGPEQFRSEIVWSYRRWSNSKKGLMPSHQTILFYSKSDYFKFHPMVTSYSESTNLDQILQRRSRDERGKAVYARDDFGDPISNGGKKGVPLGDVWEIPYLNPKAKERVGYPTQKPVLLLEKIVGLCSDPDDLVVDPFCGSGSTLIAAELLGRRWLGIDISEDAIALAQKRLASPYKTESRLLTLGRDEYIRKDLDVLELLKGIAFHAVQRNKGIDAILTEEWNGKPVCVRIQRWGETVEQAAYALSRAAQNKGGAKAILVVVDESSWGLLGKDDLPQDVALVRSTAAAILTELGNAVETTFAQR